MNRCITFLIRLRYLILPAAVVLFFFFGYHMHFIQQQSSAKIDNILSDDDAVLADYQALNDCFLGGKGGEQIYVAFETESIYANDFLRMLSTLSSSLEEIEGVAEVTGLFSAYTVSGTEGDISIEPFVPEDELPFSGRELRTLHERIRHDPFAGGRLVNSDGTGTVLTITMEKSCGDSDTHRILNSVKNMVYTQAAAYREKGHRLAVHYAGDTVVQRAISRLQAREDFIFPLMAGCLVVVLIILFRTIAGVIIPCAVMMISVTTTIGIKSLLGSPMSTIDPMLYALITTISVADSIHFVSSFYNPSLYPQLTVLQRIPAVMKHSFLPCLLTTVTTAIGFAAIALTHIPQTRSFGLFASAGVCIGFAYTILLVPPMLFLFHRLGKKMRLPGERVTVGLFDRVVERCIVRMTRIVSYHTKAVLVSFTVLTLLFLSSALHIKTGTDPYTFLKDAHPANRDLAYIEKQFAGISSVDVVLSAESEGAFTHAENLAALDEAITQFQEIDGVTRTDSMVKLIKQMNKAMHKNSDSYYALPDSGNLISQYLLLYEMSDDVDTLYTWTDSSYTTVRVRLHTAHGADAAAVRRRIAEIVDLSRFTVPVELSVTGSAVLWEHVDSLFIAGQLTSLIVSLTVISVILFFIFASVRFGLFSLAVNLFPIVAGLGIMGISGISLSMGTVMIAPIAIGIAVDDTIHFIFRFRREQSEGSTFPETVLRVYRVLFRPIVFTSLILSIGFFSNMLSSFKPNAYFGLIAGIVILLAMLTDLFLLPVLIKMFKEGSSDNE